MRGLPTAKFLLKTQIKALFLEEKALFVLKDYYNYKVEAGSESWKRFLSIYHSSSLELIITFLYAVFR